MDKNKKEKTSVFSIITNIIALVIFVGIPLIAYRSCTSGYEIYSFYIQTSDENVFSTHLSANDDRIISKGRKLTEEIMIMDREIDAGDGEASGKLRWYVCSGIDCDEGWESSFIQKTPAH